jgi:hypothetical protein
MDRSIDYDILESKISPSGSDDRYSTLLSLVYLMIRIRLQPANED